MSEQEWTDNQHFFARLLTVTADDDFETNIHKHIVLVVGDAFAPPSRHTPHLSSFPSSSSPSVTVLIEEESMKSKETWLAVNDLLYARELRLNESHAGDAEVEEIVERMPNLCSFHIEYSPMTVTGLTHLCRLPFLHSLTLIGIHLGVDGVRAIVTHAPQLQILNLPSCALDDDHPIGTDGAILIATHLFRLIQLDLSDNDVGDQGLLALCQSIPLRNQLVELNMASNPITDDSAMPLATYLFPLQKLNVEDTEMTIVGLRMLAESLTVTDHFYC